MIRRLAIAASLGIAASGAVVLAETDRPTPNPSAMSIKEIRIHNASLQSDDPDFIVCKRFAVTGSIAKKERKCLTNAVWAQQADAARDFAGKTTDKSWNSCSASGQC